MIDWASRMQASNRRIREIAPVPVAVDTEQTIENIRRIIREQEDLLPDDILAAEARRRAERTPVAAAAPARGLLAGLWSRLH